MEIISKQLVILHPKDDIYLQINKGKLSWSINLADAKLFSSMEKMLSFSRKHQLLGYRHVQIGVVPIPFNRPKQIFVAGDQIPVHIDGKRRMATIDEQGGLYMCIPWPEEAFQGTYDRAQSVGIKAVVDSKWQIALNNLSHCVNPKVNTYNKSIILDICQVIGTSIEKSKHPFVDLIGIFRLKTLRCKNSDIILPFQSDYHNYILVRCILNYENDMVVCSSLISSDYIAKLVHTLTPEEFVSLSLQNLDLEELQKEGDRLANV